MLMVVPGVNDLALNMCSVSSSGRPMAVDTLSMFCGHLNQIVGQKSIRRVGCMFAVHYAFFLPTLHILAYSAAAVSAEKKYRQYSFSDLNIVIIKVLDASDNSFGHIHFKYLMISFF